MKFLWIFVVFAVFSFTSVSHGQSTGSGNLFQNGDLFSSFLQMFNQGQNGRADINDLLSNRLLKPVFEMFDPNSNITSQIEEFLSKIDIPKEMETFLTSLVGSGNVNQTEDLQDMIMTILSSIKNFANPNSTTISEILGKFFPNESLPFQLLSMLNHNPEIMQGISSLFSYQNSTGVLGVLSRVEPLLMGYLKGLLPSLNEGLMSMNVSSNCSGHITMVISEMLSGHPWALKYLDAIGKPSSGLMEGGLLWMGSYHECINIHHPNKGESLDGNYCLLKIPLPVSSLQALVSGAGEAPKPQGMAAVVSVSLVTLSYGLCVPSSCSAEDVYIIVNNGLMDRLPASVYGEQKQEVMPTCRADKDVKHDDRAKIVIAVCACIGFFILVGTLFDVITELTWKHKTLKNSKTFKTENIMLSNMATNGIGEKVGVNYNHGNGSLGNGTMAADRNKANGNVSSSHDGDIEETKVDVYVINKETKYDDKSTTKPEVDPNRVAGEKKSEKQQRPKEGIVGGLLLAFSLYTNMRKILNTDQRSGSLGAVNGVRFLSMSWVILGHTYFFHLTAENNVLGYSHDFVERWTAQGILNALVSVDSFFTLSGLLVAYLTLKEMAKKKSAKINWFMFYFHRFWRLTPPYMLVLVVYLSLLQYWGSGPMWPNGQIEQPVCNKYWWRNLLYINNFQVQNQCMGWAWYLANDMQFYIISPLILIPLFYSKIVGLTILGLFFLATFIATGVISYVNEFLPMDSNPEFMQLVYMKPWCRIGPYLVGLLVGYILYRTKCKVKLHTSTVILGWSCAAVTALATLYGVYGNDHGYPMTLGVSALYNALHRTAWGAALGWVLFACSTGYGGVINSFLSWKAFVPLARLTYMTYLLHPIVMIYYSLSTPAPMYMSDVNMSYMFIGDLFFSYAFAFLVSLAFEAPMMGLERVIFRRK